MLTVAENHSACGLFLHSTLFQGVLRLTRSLIQHPHWLVVLRTAVTALVCLSLAMSCLDLTCWLVLDDFASLIVCRSAGLCLTVVYGFSSFPPQQMQLRCPLFFSSSVSVYPVRLSCTHLWSAVFALSFFVYYVHRKSTHSGTVNCAGSNTCGV